MRIRFSPLAMLLITLLTFLISNAVTLRRDISILLNRIAILALIYCVLHNYMTLFIINKSIGIHGGLLFITNFTQTFHIFILLICILILQLTSFYVRKEKYIQNKKLEKIINIINIEHLKIIEYPLILLFIITGAILLISTNDLVSIFLAIELQSYGLYLLSTIHRNSEFSTTGGLTYFLLGSLSSCIILLGISIIYSNTGTSNLDNIYIINNIINNTNFAFLILSVGLLFKISAAPFHFWSPDVYDAIPTLITTFVSIIAKISILILILQLVFYTNNSTNWTIGLLISSVLSLVIGTLAGLIQFRIKRLFAYSTISHVGFLLLGLSIYSVESIQAFIFYLLQYSITNLNMFIMLIMMGYSLNYLVTDNKEFKNLLDKVNSPIQIISQLRGYFFINPILAISFIITIFSFVGIPPLVGFFGKQMILSAAIDKNYIFISLIAITTSVISGVFYLNVIKEIFFFNPYYKENNNKNYLLKDKSIFNNNNIIIPNPIAITISFITLITLFYIFINKEILSMNTILVSFLFNN